MNESKREEKQFRFLIKEIESDIKVLKLTTSSNVIKSRNIHLLEWAVIAPLVELDKPKPSMKEIAQEFGIERVEFLYHAARQLSTLGIINEIGRHEYEVTDVGRALYKKGKMLSDPREIEIPIFYEKESAEWFIGSNITDNSIIETVPISDEFQFSACVPDYIPEEVINQHAKATKRIGNNEQILENEILGADEIVVPLKARLFLNAEGIEAWATEQPFGDEYRKLLSKALKHNLLQTGKIKHHFKEFFEAIEGYTSLQKVQPHRIPQGAKLFLPDEPSKMVDYIMKSEPKWLITNDSKLFDTVEGNVNKPSILIYLKKESDSFTIEKSNEDIIPKAIELVVPVTDVDSDLILEGSFVSENIQSSLNIIEAEGCEVPFYVVQENSHHDKGKELLISVLEKSDEKFNEKLAKYYLEQTEANFYDVIENYPLEAVMDRKTSKKALDSISGLKSKIESFSQNSGTEFKIYDKIIGNLLLADLVEFDVNTIIQCKKAYFSRLNQLFEKDFVEAGDTSWESISSFLEKRTEKYNMLMLLKDHIEQFGEAKDSELCLETEKLIERSNKLILEQINLLPNPTSEVDIEKLLKVVDLYKHSKIESTCIDKINSFLSPEKASIQPDKLLDIYFNLSRKGLAVAEDKLYPVIFKSFDAIGFDLLDADLHKKVKKLSQKCKELLPGFDLDSIITVYLPESTEKIDSKNKVNILITNLSELSKITKIINEDYLGKIIGEQESILRGSENFEDLKIWLALLSNTRKKIEKRTEKEILEQTKDEIWDVVYPYIEEDMSIISIIEKELKELGLGEEIKNIKNKSKKKASKNSLRKEKRETSGSETSPEERINEESDQTSQSKLLSCPSCNKVSLGYIDIESSKPILSCGYCKQRIELESDKFVFDTNILVDCLFSNLSDTDFFTGKTIIIPETVSDEVNHWKYDNKKRILHKIALEEIKKIREANDQGKITYKIRGKEASYDELIEKGRADKIIARDGQKENAIVLTGDKDFYGINPDVSVLIYKKLSTQRK